MDDNGPRRPAEMTNDDEQEAKRIRLDEAAMPTATPTPTTIFDSKGDLYLVVGGDICDEDPPTFLVCSRALARASPVFEKMLFGSYAESCPSANSSKQDSAWVVHLPEDEPAYLEVMLNILHFNFKRMPRKLSPPPLSGMITVADKYDCIGIFQPWLDSCIPSVEFDDTDPKLALHIAWQLGCISTFRETLLVIIEKSFISEDGGISIVPNAFMNLNADGDGSAAEPQSLKTYLGELVPEEVVDIIKGHRAKVINAVMEPFFTLHDDLANSRERCPVGRNQLECDNLLLGSLIRSFRKTTVGEPTRDAARKYCGTITDLERSLESIKLVIADGHDGKDSSCREELDHRRMHKRRLQKAATKSEAIVLPPKQVERLEKQAVISGLR